MAWLRTFLRITLVWIERPAAGVTGMLVASPFATSMFWKGGVRGGGGRACSGGRGGGAASGRAAAPAVNARLDVTVPPVALHVKATPVMTLPLWSFAWAENESEPPVVVVAEAGLTTIEVR